MVREDRDLERSALVLQPPSLGGSSPSADAAHSNHFSKEVHPESLCIYLVLPFVTCYLQHEYSAKNLKHLHKGFKSAILEWFTVKHLKMQTFLLIILKKGIARKP